jgi:hypothetical protein
MPIGSNFDDFLKEQGMFELCSAAAIKNALQSAPFDAADGLIDDATVAAYLAAHWDIQIANDLKAGKLNHLIAKAKAEMAAGTARDH